MPTKLCLIEAMFFPVVMYGCESWTIKKADCQRIDAFELWCWRRLLRIPWTSWRSNQSFLKEITPEQSLEGLMLKLKLPYFGHLMQRTDPLERPFCWERLKAGGEGDDRGWDGWMASLTQWDGHEFEQTLGDSEGQGSQVYCSPWGFKELEVTLWTELNWKIYKSVWICVSWASLVAQMVKNPPAS